MTHDERVAAVKNYRGVYKVIKNAPLIIDEAFINKYNISSIGSTGFDNTAPWCSGQSITLYSCFL